MWESTTGRIQGGRVTLVAIAWATGEAEPLFLVHVLAGYGVIIAVLFRIMWGVTGSRHARFRNFIYPLPAVMAHLRDLAKRAPHPSLGHNPAGGWMVIILIATVGATAITGLFAAENDVAGPLAYLLSPSLGDMMAELHEGLWGALLFLILFHIAGVLVESFLTRDNLIGAMVTGFKGSLGFDASKPDGALRKLMDVSRLTRLGWSASIGLEQGIRDTYAWFLEQGLDNLRSK